MMDWRVGDGERKNDAGGESKAVKKAPEQAAEGQAVFLQVFCFKFLLAFPP